MASEPGWVELRAGRWEAARAAFEAADETAEPLEGLSWAAWWLDDAGRFDARERAYRRYREDGDARRRADGDLARGRRARLPRRARPSPRAGCDARAGCSSRSSRGRTTAGSHSTRATPRIRRRIHEWRRSRGRGRRARAALRRCRPRDARARSGGRLVGARAEVEAGMRCLDEATATALGGEATIPISSAWTCCMLVTACVNVQDYERRRVVRPDCRVRRALRQPLHARLLPGQVRRR